MNENVTVCITPKGDKPVLHFSQFDNERVFTVTVLADDGETAAVLTGLDIEFRLRKTDSHVVTIAPESVTDNVITFKTTEQMCACCGQNIASVTLMKDDMNIATLDILVDIQRDILSGGLTSESDIRNLNTQIEQIVPEVIGDDYYNKQEVDDLLAEHTFDPTNYYNKSVVDDLLADKADSDDVYTKTETDNLLDGKMNVIETKSLADSICSFNDGSNDIPLKACEVSIVPDLAGYTECNLYVTKKSVVVRTLTQVYVDSNGIITESSSIYPYRCVIARVNQGETYTYSVNGVVNTIPVMAFFSKYPVIGSQSYNSSRIVETNSTFIAPIDGFVFIRGSGSFDEVNQMVSIGSSVSEYETPTVYTIAFGETLTTGGTLNVITGELVITGGSAVQCIPISPKTLPGINNIYNDCGNTSITYFTDSADDIADFIRLVTGD